MASGQVVMPIRLDMADLPIEQALFHGLAGFDSAGTFTFRVPPGVSRLYVDLCGAWALGGGFWDAGSSTLTFWSAQGGARVTHWIDVVPGEVLTIVVGAAGANNNAGGSTTVAVNGVALLTAGGGTPSSFSFTSGSVGVPVGATGGMVASSGGNVLTQGSGTGYCVIAW